MARHPDAFPAWQSAIVRMGEASGRMDQAFAIISEILESRRSYWLGLLSRLAAPLLVIHLAPLILNAPLCFSQGFSAYLRAVLKVLLKLYLPVAGLWLAWPWLKESAPLVRFRRFDAKRRFCACLTVLIRAGIPLARAVEISCSAADRPPPPEDWERRETIVDRLAQLGVFSQEELGLLRVAEYSGTVDAALAHLAEQVRSGWQALPGLHS